jgi:hypothetical protein
LVVKRTRYNSYIYPATHFAAPSSNTSTNLPSMGQRLRLKASVTITNSWTPEEKAVLLALKKYGAMVADNGNFFSISVTPDNRWPANCFNHFTNISITNFEVIQSTGPNEGPRSPGAPVVNAGADQSVAMGSPAQLQGVATFSGATPLILWKLYSGPGIATFGDASQTNTSVSFSTPGTYTLMLSADDGVHAVAYDAVVFTVSNSISLSASVSGTNLLLSWSGGLAPYTVQQADALSLPAWNDLFATSGQNATIPITNAGAFFRVQGN